MSTAHSWRFEAIGTAWEIATSQPIPAPMRAEVTDLIAAFDASWSRFRDDSAVRAIASGGAVPAPHDTDAMLSLLGEASDATGGAVDPLVGASLEALGYDARYTLRGGDPVATHGDWRTRVAWDSRELRLDGPGVIDVGALGKGRLVDLVHARLREAVGGDIVVDASGDMRVSGAPVLVGLEHPHDPARAIGVWTIRDQALAASAVTRRAWGDGLHHVLDARTGMPVRRVIATWAIAGTAMTADAVATALFFDGGDRFAALRHDAGDAVQWVRMLTDGRVEYSPGCSAVLSTGGSTE